MTRARLIATVAVGLVAAVAMPSTVAGAASVSHAKLFQNASHKVTCGVEIHAASVKAKWVICSARGLPRPKGASNVGDPFVRLAHTGRPQLVLESQDPFVGTKAVTIAISRRWSALGVTCQVDSKTVACFDVSGHGFNIGNGKYREF